MTVALGGHPVQQVDDTILQPADVESVDDVRDQRARIAARCASPAHRLLPFRVLERRRDRRPAIAHERLQRRVRVPIVAGWGIDDDHRGIVTPPRDPQPGDARLGNRIARRQRAIDPVPLPRLDRLTRSAPNARRHDRDRGAADVHRPRAARSCMPELVVGTKQDIVRAHQLACVVLTTVVGDIETDFLVAFAQHLLPHGRRPQEVGREAAPRCGCRLPPWNIDDSESRE